MSADEEAANAEVPEVPFTEPTLKPLFYTGEEALREVARLDGLWNWALVGPDPDRLPLSGGGSGSIDEMQHAIGAQATSFGLLRMTFGTGPATKTKFIYVHASNIDDENSMAWSMKERAQAMANAPRMERAIHGFKQTQVKVEITRADECTLEFILEKLVKVSFHDAGFLTEENYREALEEFRAAHPVTHEEVAKEEEAVKLLEDLAPAPESHEPEPEQQPEAEVPEPVVTRVRKKVRLFKPGELVLVWSENTQRWHDDGEVVQTLDAASSHNGSDLNAGSMKVVYNNGMRFKWIDPAFAAKLLRSSNRPRPPPVKFGDLSKETHSIFAEWHIRYFELSKGFLMWWRSGDDAVHGKAATHIVPLLGLSLRVDGTQFSFWTFSTKGTMFALNAASVSEATQWARAMIDHARYAAQMKEYLECTSGDNAGPGHDHRPDLEEENME